MIFFEYSDIIAETGDVPGTLCVMHKDVSVDVGGNYHVPGKLSYLHLAERAYEVTNDTENIVSVIKDRYLLKNYTHSLSDEDKMILLLRAEVIY